MKCLITSNWHIGHTSNKVDLDEWLLKGIDFMLDYAEKNGIVDIVHVGDFFDTRRHINFKVINTVNVIKAKFHESGINFYAVHGKFDVPDVRNMEVSLFDIISKGDNIENYGFLCDGTVDGSRVIFSPYGSENDIEGAAEGAEAIFTYAETPPEFESSTFNGYHHYRSNSAESRVVDVGTLHQLDWSMSEQETGFIHYDNGEFKFVDNPFKVFIVARVEGGKIEGVNPIKWVMTNKDKLKNANLSVIVDDSSDRTIYEKMLALLETVRLNDLQINEERRFSEGSLDVVDMDIAALIEAELTRDGAKLKLREILKRID